MNMVYTGLYLYYYMTTVPLLSSLEDVSFSPWERISKEEWPTEKHYGKWMVNITFSKVNIDFISYNVTKN